MRAELAKLARALLLVGSGVAAALIPLADGLALPWRARAVGRAEPAPVSAPAAIAHYARFGAAVPSADARHLADWVADTRDNAGSDFVIVDKKLATLYVFDADASLRATTPVLLGAALGDESVPGIGSRPIAEVLPHERTTPAGRFMAERGHNALGHDVVWVDYGAAVSMHRVITTHAAERRLQRLASASVDDKRISYGCINVPVAFYEAYIRPAFAARRGPVYVMPERNSVQQTFGSYDVATAHRARPAATTDTTVALRF